MSNGSRFALLTAIAALLVGLVAGVDATSKPLSNWGFICTRAEDKKQCCADKQIACAFDCIRDYTGDAIDTCKKVCARKGDTCGNEIKKTPAPKWERPQEEGPSDPTPVPPKPPTQQQRTR